MDRSLPHGETFRTAGAPAGEYSYQELPSATQYIRLLELDHNDPLLWLRGDVRCKLKVWLLEAAPKYHAVSYVWGDPSRNQAITVDGDRLLVPRGTYEALRQLSLFDTCQYYFIDSICIHQDDLEEKNGQVAAMGRIFHQAGHVLVCLGCKDDGAEAAMHIIHEVELHGARHETRMPCVYREANDTSIEHFDRLSNNLAILLDLLQDRFGNYLRGVAALSNRPYFQRMWIVQELLLAREASICCGSARLAIAAVEFHMLLALQVFHLKARREPYVWREASSWHVTDFAKPWQERDPHLYFDYQGTSGRVSPMARGLLKNLVYGTDGPRHHRFTFPQALSLAEGRSCTDKRDCVFSLLPLIDWKGEESIQPDYKKSAFQLTVEILRTTSPRPLLASSQDLVKMLDLGPENVELQKAIEERRQEGVKGRAGGHVVQYKPVFIKLASRFADDEWQRVDLTPETCRIEDSPRYGNDTQRIVLKIESGEAVVIAARVRMYDVLIWKHAYFGLVTRWRGNLLTIVGHAFFPPGGRPPHSRSRDCCVLLDPEDALVAGSLWSRIRPHARVDSEARDEALALMLRTRICKRSSSSYAMLKEVFLQTHEEAQAHVGALTPRTRTPQRSPSPNAMWSDHSPSDDFAGQRKVTDRRLADGDAVPLLRVPTPGRLRDTSAPVHGMSS